MSAPAERASLHRLVDDLPEAELDTAKKLLRGLIALQGDPLLWALATAPEDDEPVNEEDIAAEAEADEAIAQGRVVPHEEVLRQLGL